MKGNVRYADVGAEVEQRGWRVRVCPVEKKIRVFIFESSVSLQEDGVRGRSLRRTGNVS